ncbi:Glycosyl transferase family 2 [compost metagenome]
MLVTGPNGGGVLAIAGEDIRRLYLLFLRREPESALPDKIDTGVDLFSRAGDFVRSQEFSHNVLAPPVRGQLPPLARVPLDRETLAWACRRLQLDRETRRKLFSARSWMQAYDALFSDALFLERANLADVVFGATGSVGWASSCMIQGEVESFDGRVLRGWARHNGIDGEPLQLQIWLNGALLTLTSTGVYRPDLALRFQSEGLEGFEAWLPSGVSGDIRWEVREAISKLLIGRHDAYSEEAHSGGGLREVRQELSALRSAMEALEARLPQAMAMSTLSLDDYPTYYERFRRHAAASAASDSGVVILIDAVGCCSEYIEDAVLSALAQSHDRKRIVVGIDEVQRAFLADLIIRLSWISPVNIVFVVADVRTDWRLLVELLAEDDIVQLMSGDGVIHPACVAEVAAWFDKNGPDALYFDEDELGGLPGDEVSRRQHVSPVLKPPFDLDLLLQSAYPGVFVAFRRRAWSAVLHVLEGRPLGSWAGSRCLLELARDGAAVGHLSVILASRQSPHVSASLDDWATCVAEYLGSDASISPHTDILGAAAPLALRIRRRVQTGTSAAVIIPTRDRLDLLRPCVDSLLAREADNVVEMSIVLVDHETSEPLCIAYIENLERDERVRRIPFSGSFNWSLMNNLAAWQCEADVLVFLNNDTVAISPDWLDALVSEAMRPDVGVVGCRLIYADGAIQHAGFVSLDARDHFLTHEGLGAPGSDAGYLGRHALVHETIAVTGACMAVRKDVFKRLGGFDAARFAVEGNDVDFCFKARAAGLKVLYSPNATLYHLESRTRTFDEDHRQLSAEASRRLWDRWGSAVCPDPYFNRHFDRRSRPFTRLRQPLD